MELMSDNTGRGSAVAVLTALVSGLLKEELKAWSGWVVERLIKWSVARLPESQRARFQEEWRSHINELPGEIGRLYAAAGFILGARRISVTASGNRREAAAGEVLRRMVEVLGSSLLLIYFPPLFALIAVAIRLTGNGPVIVKQRRMGMAGREFNKCTFGGSGRLSRFLFRFGFVGFPQLINVLRGEMTFVGPHPDSPAIARDISKLIPEWNERTRVKPGIIGLAQINVAEILNAKSALQGGYLELNHDLFYIKNRNLKLDILILWRWLAAGFWRQPESDLAQSTSTDEKA
jgi:lipopolysaccharide/colanic/teichoic acid biosynthesis glycosyltransferase